MRHLLKPRILCIDDEPSVGELVRALLEGTGDFRVEVETKAIAAFNRARTFRPDLIIMDIKMPGRDGFSLAREFRKEPWLCHKPIIFFTGLEDMGGTSPMAWRSAPTEFLEKGVSVQVIEQTVRNILAERIEQYQAGKAAA